MVFEAEHPNATNEDKIVYSTSSNKPNTTNEDKIVCSTSSNKPVEGYTKNSTAIIERKLYIVDDLLAKALIGIDIIKPEGIVVDLGNDVMRIGAYNNIEVPIIAIPRGPLTSATVYSSKRTVILAYSNVAVPITGPKGKLELPDNRDLMFELRTLDTLSRNQQLGHISEYDASAHCDPGRLENYNLATKAPKGQPNWIRTNIRRLVAGATAFSTTFPMVTESVHLSGIIIYSSEAARASISTIVDSFPTL